MLSKTFRSTLLAVLGLPVYHGCAMTDSNNAEPAVTVHAPQIWPVRDHGAIAPVAEIRGRLIVDTEEGPAFVTTLRDMMPGGGSRASLFIMNLPSGEHVQYFYPSPDEATGDVYCILPTSRGTLAFMTGDDTFRVFDLNTREYVFVGEGVQGLAMSLAEAADGRIFIATFPSSRLFEYDPDSHQIRELVRLHHTQQYPLQLVVGDDGWIYAGLGFAEAALVAYEPDSGTLRTLDTGTEPRRGGGMLLRTEDGTLAGRLHADEPWRILKDGALREAVEEPGEPDATGRSVFWNIRDRVTAHGYTVEAFDVEQGVLHFRDPAGKLREWPFDYESFGASISAMAVSPDGRIIGSSDHPNLIWSYDPQNDTAEVHGGIPALGGGALTRFIAYGDYLISNSYPRGNVYAIDTTRPINLAGEGAELNPQVIAQTSPWIGRPRVMHRHSSGHHFISTGFPGYGRVGGGMLIYDLDAGQVERFLEAEDLIPGQTVMSLAELPSGDLVLVSSIHTPGGGQPVAEHAVIVHFDWPSRQVIRSYKNIPQAQSFAASALMHGRYLHLVTRDDQYHLYDLQEEQTLVSRELGDHGRAAARRGDTAFAETEDGRLLLVTMHTLFEVDPLNGTFTERATFPYGVLDTGPIFDGRLYLGAAGNMLSVPVTLSGHKLP